MVYRNQIIIIAELKIINFNYKNLKKEIFKTNAVNTKIVSIVQFLNANGIKIHKI